ncbi:MAG: GPW/gp25 family protein [Pseudomonadota bacterium]
MSQPPRFPRPRTSNGRHGGYGDVYPAFLGRGWSFPPTFNRLTSSVTMAAGDADIKEALWIILSTSLGERIMLATFGCDLISKVFSALTTTTANDIATMVTRAIIEWEPRVTIESVTVTDSELAGWIDINVDYIVRQTNSRSNIVYPFYAMEASLPPPPG